MVSTNQNSNPLQNAAFSGASITSTSDNLSKIGAEIVSTVLAGYGGNIAVQLWDGTLAQGKPDAPCTLIFREPGALRDLIWHRNVLRLTECYLTGSIDAEGDLELLFEFKSHLINLDLSLGTRLRLLRQALRLPGRTRRGSTRNWRAKLTSHRNSQASIAHHYDVSNDFYGLWLDPEMVYSCAYFSAENQSLADAQLDKLDYLCRKLRLKPGQTLLDIGCGWGALALWAARHYGVQVYGITLSREQLRLAQTRIREAGLESQVYIELLDYRDLPQDVQYDRVISVGMFEHVGINNYPTYFGMVQQVLKPGGLFLNHGITDDSGWKRTPLTRFMNRYIFPDGELARISDVTDAMERAGFEMLDVESLRRHYVLTLRRWVAALENKHSEAIRYSSEVTYRLWRLYMAGCAYQFDEGGIGLHQVLAGHQHTRQPVPLRRNDLYANSSIDQEKQRNEYQRCLMPGRN